MTATTSAARSGTRPGYLGRKADHLARLARIEGQVREVARMVDGDLLGDHLRHCVIDAARADPGEGEQKEVPDGYRNSNSRHRTHGAR